MNEYVDTSHSDNRVVSDSVDIRNQYPPNYDAIVAGLGRPPRGAVFAYDRVIYAPDGAKSVTFDIIVHEQVHFVQQAAVGGAEAWWEQYIADPMFRLAQECEAYHVQYNIWPSRDQRRAALKRAAKDLASPMYRLPISEAQAKSLIRTGRLPAMAVPA